MMAVVDFYDDVSESEWPGKRRRDIDTHQRHTYRLLRDQFRRQCAAAGAPCWICGDPVDYGLPHGDPWAWELDHVEPVEVAPELALVPSNFASSHAGCNRRRGLVERLGGDGGVPDTGVASESWD